ncbi:MAG: potassium transporter Kup [Proteobacteria bacterium]|nr:potassium transporter Kup [Pseudomonadota bacterium]
MTTPKKGVDLGLSGARVIASRLSYRRRSQFKTGSSQNDGSSGHHQDSLLFLALGALGVVYGDIGTSPLYALRESFNHGGMPLTPDNILGILSLVFWTLLLIICFKYMVIILRADNKGEGGILSLMALALKNLSCSPQRKSVLVVLGLIGAALLYGDGVITPAISVLSAVEGLKVVTPVFAPFVVPLTVVIIIGLFIFQFLGTGRIGVVFGPIIVVWFIVLGVLGLSGILDNPEVLRAVGPHYAIQFLMNNGFAGLLVLGSVFLVVTGGEALYADMGHFGKSAIRWAWFAIGMPGLTLNYFGQGALLLSNPEAISNPFYLLVPSWGLWPMVLLATAATVIASQALISGVFSITRQAVQLGYCPRLSIIHTSSKEIGQIYIPFINWALMLGVVWLVISFKTSSNLASAYGIAVTGTMVITTILAYEVSRKIWGWTLWQSVGVFGFFLLIDLAFFATNVVKVMDGGWVPLAIGAGIYLLMSTWQSGRKILAQRLKARSIPMVEFIQKLEVEKPQRVPGNAIYMSGDTWGVPVPLLHNLKHNKVLHSRLALLTIKTKDVPFVNPDDRIQIETLAPDLYRIIALYGFMETPKIKHILEACREAGIPFQVADTTFVLGRETLIPTGDPTMSVWREKVFAFMARNAERPTNFFKIPPNQVIEVGIQVEI